MQASRNVFQFDIYICILYLLCNIKQPSDFRSVFESLVFVCFNSFVLMRNQSEMTSNAVHLFFFSSIQNILNILLIICYFVTSSSNPFFRANNPQQANFFHFCFVTPKEYEIQFSTVHEVSYKISHY